MKAHSLVILMALGACTVLEDRNACPCLLHLDLSNPSNQVSDSIYLSIESSSYSGLFVVDRRQYEKGLDVSVPGRGGVIVSAYNSESSEFIERGSLLIPHGQQCPGTYMDSFICDISADESKADICLHKNYCGVSLSFADDRASDYEVEVSGNVCGYSKGEPSEGSFTYLPDFSTSSLCYFRIPRQKDNTLRLGISLDGEQPRYFALGNYIVQSGYDWTKDDLDDIALLIDYVSMSIVVTINDWKKEIDRDIVI